MSDKRFMVVTLLIDHMKQPRVASAGRSDLADSALNSLRTLYENSEAADHGELPKYAIGL
jgi:hypothetical protein